jgi:hypothetical protein
LVTVLTGGLAAGCKAEGEAAGGASTALAETMDFADDT